MIVSPEFKKDDNEQIWKIWAPELFFSRGEEKKKSFNKVLTIKEDR